MNISLINWAVIKAFVILKKCSSVTLQINLTYSTNEITILELYKSEKIIAKAKPTLIIVRFIIFIY